MNLAEALLHALKDHGATRIFGIPGDFALPLFKVIEEFGILPLHTLSHEPGVGFAADGAARIGGGLGVAAVTYGAGAFNLVNAVAGACAERSPVVVVSGAPSAAERGSGFLVHHQAKTLELQYRVFEEITCDQVRLDDAARAPALIARVLRSALDHSMPVYIELPRDMVTAPAARVTALTPRPADPDALAECAGEILARLRAAKAPALMVGVETRRYRVENEVADLARRLGAAGGHELHGARAAGAARGAAARHLSRRRGRPRDHEPRRELGCAAALGRAAVGHQLRRLGAAHRPAPGDPRVQSRGPGRPPRLSGHPARRADRGAARAAAGGRGGRRAGAARGGARAGQGRRADHADRHRARGQRHDGRARADADRLRHGRLPVHGDGHGGRAAGGARLLRRHGLRRAGGPRRAGARAGSGR